MHWLWKPPLLVGDPEWGHGIVCYLYVLSSSEWFLLMLQLGDILDVLLAKGVGHFTPKVHCCDCFCPEFCTKRNISFKVPADKGSLWWPYFITHDWYLLPAQLPGLDQDCDLALGSISWLGKKWGMAARFLVGIWSRKYWWGMLGNVEVLRVKGPAKIKGSRWHD